MWTDGHNPEWIHGQSTKEQKSKQTESRLSTNYSFFLPSSTSIYWHVSFRKQSENGPKARRNSSESVPKTVWESSTKISKSHPKTIWKQSENDLKQTGTTPSVFMSNQQRSKRDDWNLWSQLWEFVSYFFPVGLGVKHGLVESRRTKAMRRLPSQMLQKNFEN